MFWLCRALALAPFVDRGLSWFTTKMKFESQGKVSEIVNSSRVINVTRFLQFIMWFCNSGFRCCCWVLLWFGFCAVSHSYITLGVKIFCCPFIQVGIYQVSLLKVILVQVKSPCFQFSLTLFIITFGKLIGRFLLYFIFGHKIITSYANFVHGLRGSDKRCCIPFRLFITLGVLKILVILSLGFLAHGIVI